MTAELKKLNTWLTGILGHDLTDWEREELAEKIFAIPPEIRLLVIRHLPVIWPVSYALFYSFVDQAVKAGECLTAGQFNDWVKAALDVYETDGLKAAQTFLAEVESNFSCRIRGEYGIKLAKTDNRLAIYASSLLGREVGLAAGQPGFDTETLSLPAESAHFTTSEENFLFYKFTTTFLLGLDLVGSFRVTPDTDKGADTLASFFAGFTDQNLATELYFLAEGARILSRLHSEYAGLMRDCRPILAKIRETRRGLDSSSPKERFVEALRDQLLTLACQESFSSTKPPADSIPALLVTHFQRAGTAADSLILTKKIYPHCEKLAGTYYPDGFLPFMGRLSPDKAIATIERRREELREKFIQALAAVIPPQKAGKSEKEENDKPQSRSQTQEPGTALLMQPTDTAAPKFTEETSSPDLETNIIHINDHHLEMNEELQELARQIRREHGQLPGEYIVSAIGRAGQGHSPGSMTEPENESAALAGPLLYDEWDYRRSGFRRNWCNLITKEINPVSGSFVRDTLGKYRGLLGSLRRQFEMMNLQEHFVRRQRDGDEIDFDALIDSVADTRAGLAPTDRLFIRLQRNVRNIAALFLVDMSSSTEGWISEALKESLILMSESLAVLGDRYAIYGFSGMRRSRSEFYRIKDFDEGYDERIKGRIAAITPKEYTRMGPPIRHATGILSNTEAKVRLLITLSDGKPEDYDGYNGVYAIEDTRHALIEAKSAGIHPFCITVDRKAQDYISHLYGEVNYIFIDNVAKLPARMPEIYRNLTS